MWKENKAKKAIILMLCFFLVIGSILWYFMHEIISREKKTDVVTIAIMQDDKVQDYNTNYYKTWLENKTGYQINFVYIQPNYYKEYVRALLRAKEGSIDAIFFPKDREILTEEEFKAYINSGSFTNLLEFMDEGTNLYKLFETYREVKMKDNMTDSDGGVYYMPNMDTSRQAKNFQVLWINLSWLKKLGIRVPKTTQELQEVLRAFKAYDANENGIQDEIPLLSCESKYELQSYNYLLNAFIPNDPYRKRFYLNPEGNITCALAQEEFREGLKYCRTLYKEELLAKEGFYFTQRQIQELINDPANLVGAFTSKSISDLVYTNSADILSRYIQVPPIEGPFSNRNAIRQDYVLSYGGIIPINSMHKKEAFHIMDFMLSEEASLIGLFGEEGVDWKFSEESDLSTYGTKAKITTVQYLFDKIQNKHFMGAGPQLSYERYIDFVTWNGSSSNVEYINSRAIMGYEPHYLKDYPDINITLHEDYVSYTDEMITMFIKGDMDVFDDYTWNAFLNGLERLY